MAKDISYHNYQQILDLGHTGSELKQRKIRKKYTKSRDGCLCCKKRRKKCDEQKPVCKGCVRNKLECTWPTHVDTTGKQEVKEPEGIDEMFSSLPEDFAMDDDLLLEQFLDIQSANKINFEITPPSSRSNSMSSPKTNGSLSPRKILGPHSPKLQIPGVPMSNRDLICYDAFINIFIKSISPSHCNSLISPLTILSPFAITSSIVREIFLACGASLLAYDNDSFKVEANTRYVRAVNSLIQEIKQSEDTCEDHLFICVQLLQTLCLRDKSIGLNGTKSAAHLSASYEIIKKRFAKKTYMSGNYNINPLDKILVEHFVYNYPITIMMCSHVKLKKAVPSPFKFFEQFQCILEKSFDEDIDDEWLNHPIVGVGLKAHELSVKCSWLCRLSILPPSEDLLVTITNLKEEAEINMKHMDSLETMPTLTVPQCVNIAYSKSQLYACSIILKKLHSYESITAADLQLEVEGIITQMRYCEDLEPDFVHSIWTLFIGGSTSLTAEQRSVFRRWFKKVADCINSSLCLKILKYLNIIWDEEGDGLNNDKAHAGFEFLFDTSVLDIVCT